MSEAFSSDGYTIPFQLTKGMHRDLYNNISPSNPELSVTGKVVIISGATGGLGYNIAQAWSKAGAGGIVLFGRKQAELKDIAKEFEVPTLVCSGTVTSNEDVISLFSESLKRFGKVDCLINCAGSFAFGAMTGEAQSSEWFADFEVNVKGTYSMCQNFIKLMGGKGTIVNLVSLGASFTAPGMSSYACSKLAVIKLGELLSHEHPDLRVFSVHPGIVEAENGRGMVLAPFTPFAKDKGILTGAVTLYMQTRKADFLRGGFYSVNWDLNEMEEHQEEILEKKLLKLAFINAELQAGGYQWST